MKKALLIAGMLLAGQAMAGADELLQLAPQIVNLVTGQLQAQAQQPSSGKMGTMEIRTTHEAPASADPGGKTEFERFYSKLDRCDVYATAVQRSNGGLDIAAKFLKGKTPRIVKHQAIYAGHWDFHGLPVSEVRLAVMDKNTMEGKSGLIFDAGLEAVQKVLSNVYHEKWATVATLHDRYGSAMTRTLESQGSKTLLTCTIPTAGD